MKAMNSLWVRLTLVFTLIALATLGMLGVLSNRLVSTEFRYYVVRSDVMVAGGVVDRLADYYKQHGSWDGIGTLLDQGVRLARTNSSRMNPGVRTPWLDVVLTDAKGHVVYDAAHRDTGIKLSLRQLGNGMLISDEDTGKVLGYLLIALPRPEALGTLERAYLTKFGNALFAATGVAIALGIAASAVFSLNLTAPLRRLAVAARAVAQGDLSHRVAEQGTSEMVEVTRSFNEMTSSLEQAERLRQNLMADVAHELRTPLTVLQGNLRAMLDGVYSMETTEIARLYDETRLLGRLVDDLRELAQAEAGQLGLNLRSTDVPRLLDETVDRFLPVAESRGIALAVEATTALPEIRVDPDRISQVLGNLLTNALRHTREGGRITVAAGVDADQPDSIRVSVRDTGEGIAPGDLAHVFDRFWRADRSRSRESGGSGLGLAIARSLVQAHGGRIVAESVLDQGTAITFWLPASQSAA